MQQQGRYATPLRVFHPRSHSALYPALHPKSPLAHTPLPAATPPLLRQLPLASLLELGHRLGLGLGLLAPRWPLRPLRTSPPPLAATLFSFPSGLRYHPPAGLSPADQRHRSRRAPAYRGITSDWAMSSALGGMRLPIRRQRSGQDPERALQLIERDHEREPHLVGAPAGRSVEPGAGGQQHCLVLERKLLHEPAREVAPSDRGRRPGAWARREPATTRRVHRPRRPWPVRLLTRSWRGPSFSAGSPSRFLCPRASSARRVSPDTSHRRRIIALLRTCSRDGGCTAR